MPCRDYFEDRLTPEEQQLNIRATKAEARCDTLAQMLCWLCGTLEGMDVEVDLTTNPTLFDWWNNHQAKDEERVKAEMRWQKKVFKTSEIMACTFINRALEIHAVSDYHKEWFRKLANEVFEEE